MHGQIALQVILAIMAARSWLGNRRPFQTPCNVAETDPMASVCVCSKKRATPRTIFWAVRKKNMPALELGALKTFWLETREASSHMRLVGMKETASRTIHPKRICQSRRAGTRRAV